MSDTTIVRTPLRSPLATAHGRRGAEVAVEDGAEFVRSYGDREAELATVRSAVGVADVTVRGKIDVRGDVERTVSLFPAGVVARIADDWALLLAPPGPLEDRVASMQTAAGASTMITDATHLFAGFALAGPLVGEAVARLTSWDPATLAPGRATGAPIADVRAVVVRREGQLDVLELYPAMELARYVWEESVAVVERLGGAPVGWDALHAEGWR